MTSVYSKCITIMTTKSKPSCDADAPTRLPTRFILGAIAVCCAAVGYWAQHEIRSLRAALDAEQRQRLHTEQQLHRYTGLSNRLGNPPWQEVMQTLRLQRDAEEGSKEFENAIITDPKRRFPNGYNTTLWHEHLRNATPAAFRSADGDASNVDGCAEIRDVVLTPEELAMPMSAAARAKARRALTDCGFVVLDNLIPAPTVARVREAYMRLRDSSEAADYKYPCQGEGRVEHMLPFAPPFNDSGVYDDPRLLQVVGDFLDEQFKLELMTVITSLPGSGDQRWHQGWRYLFHPDERLPPYALVATLPLQDVTPEMGPSEICPGRKLRLYYGWRCNDHSVALGSTSGTVVIFDYKTLHRGPANRAGIERAMISMVYSKAFFLNTEAAVNRGISLLQTLHQRRYWEQFFWHPTSRSEQFRV